MSWQHLRFNEKYRNFVVSSLNSTYTVAEGSWRAGKTVAVLTSHCVYLDDLEVEGLHIVGAESIATARSILLDNPTGFSYKDFFAESAIEKKYEGKDALQIVNSKHKKQILIFAGSAKSNSWQSIRGLTAMSVLITEVNIAHSSFLNEAIGRTIATPLKYRKILLDLNPKGEMDWFYLEYLNKWQERADKGEFNLAYEHFTFMDNPGIEEEEKQVIMDEYDKDSIIFKAFILGQRITQVDNIFRLKAKNLMKNITLPEQYIVAVDPGISTSSTVFITLGITPEKQIAVYNFYHHKNGRGIEQKNVKEYSDYALDLANYVKQETTKYGEVPRYVFVDTDISFLRICRTVFMKNALSSSLLRYAIKDKIEDRIAVMSSLLHTGNLIIDDELAMVKQAIEDAVYDQKELDKSGKLVRLDVPKSNKDQINFCDFLDPLDYGISWAIRQLKGLNF